MMDKEHIIVIVTAVFASSGFWAFLIAVFNKLMEKKSAKNMMIKGLGHDRIIFLCERYLDKGWISSDDFENLHDYLFLPYAKMGGNGTAAKLMEDVRKLPSHPTSVAAKATKSGKSSASKEK